MSDDETANDVLCALQDVATDDEAAMVERLAIKAGYWWKCPQPCGNVNIAAEPSCEACGTKQEMGVN